MVKFPKKLSLAKETLKTLASSELRNVLGGNCYVIEDDYGVSSACLPPAAPAGGRAPPESC